MATENNATAEEIKPTPAEITTKDKVICIAVVGGTVLAFGAAVYGCAALGSFLGNKIADTILGE
jgi:hypothetical protein